VGDGAAVVAVERPAAESAGRGVVAELELPVGRVVRVRFRLLPRPGVVRRLTGVEAVAGEVQLRGVAPEGGVALVEGAAVGEVRFLSFRPATKRLVDREELQLGEVARILGGDCLIARPVEIPRRNLLTFVSVEIF
jgi:hypothetical protein